MRSLRRWGEREPLARKGCAEVQGKERNGGIERGWHASRVCWEKRRERGLRGSGRARKEEEPKCPQDARRPCNANGIERQREQRKWPASLMRNQGRRETTERDKKRE